MILRDSPGFIPKFFRLLQLVFESHLLGYVGMVVTAHILRYYSELRQRQIQASDLRASLSHAQLRALQSRLDPHFFFNTLQAISVLAMTGDSNGVVETLSRLSNLIRASMDDTQPQQTSLASELEFLDGYIAIQELLYGDRITFRRKIESEVLDSLVPTMILQPLIENALIHGIAQRPGKGTVEIEARRTGTLVILKVEDNGAGFEACHNPGSGFRIGLRAIRARLELLYGDRYQLDFGKSTGGGASVTVTLPFVPSSQLSKTNACEPALIVSSLSKEY